MLPALVPRAAHICWRAGPVFDFMFCGVIPL